MKPTSIRLDEATLASIDGMAQALGRSRAWIIQDALAKYLTHETWFHEEVRKGQADLAAGRAVTHGTSATALPRLAWTLTGPSGDTLGGIRR
ncbi:MAG TPA: ribbon-helix-helix protein, CopG family [Nitratidesulfovibrio sp.]|nr:ribbon-helix-helix protein, CopG family [Nitratidesulfovibrio sp.]